MKEKSFEHTVFICSPYRPTSEDALEKAQEIKENIQLARRGCKLAIAWGYMPLAPHCYFTNLLDDSDPQGRKDGLKLAMGWLEISDEMWVFGNRISDGMAQEIAYAREMGIPIRMMLDPREAAHRLLQDLVDNKPKDNSSGKAAESGDKDE